MESKKRRKKIGYTVMIVPDNSGKVKSIRIKDHLLIAAAGVLLLLFIMVAYIAFVSVSFASMRAENKMLAERLAEADGELTALKEEDAAKEASLKALEEKEKEQQAKEEEQAREKEAAAVPSGLPLNGTTGVPTDFGMLYAEDGTESGMQGLVFTSGAGNSVVAAGDGTVIFVGSDAAFGNIVKIDHGNGYVSFYGNAAAAKVSEGDEVTRGKELFEIGDTDVELKYGILYEEEYKDPMTVLEIVG